MIDLIHFNFINLYYNFINFNGDSNFIDFIINHYFINYHFTNFKYYFTNFNCNFDCHFIEYSFNY